MDGRCRIKRDEVCIEKSAAVEVADQADPAMQIVQFPIGAEIGHDPAFIKESIEIAICRVNESFLGSVGCRLIAGVQIDQICLRAGSADKGEDEGQHFHRWPGILGPAARKSRYFRLGGLRLVQAGRRRSQKTRICAAFCSDDPAEARSFF